MARTSSSSQSPSWCAESAGEAGDGPQIYVPGELGIRHEDTVAVTESGCENLAPRWSGNPEEPAVV